MIPTSRSRHKKLRVGVTPYLNVKPLVWHIEQYRGMLKIVSGVPRELAGRFRRDALDVAILPIFDYFRHAEYYIVPSIAIACRGAVQSIRLFCKKPMTQIKTILADRSSLTSVNLLRVLLKEWFNISARVSISVRPLTDRHNWAAREHDAFLVIGDAALKTDAANFQCVYDLGEEWMKFARLPFVFAIWAVRGNTNLRGFDRVLLEMKDAGLKHLPSIAREASVGLGLTEKSCYSYLKNNVRYDLGDEEIQSMKFYYRLLVKHKLCPRGAKIKFYRPSSHSA